MEANPIPDEAKETATVAGDNKAGWRRGFWSLFVTQFQGAFNDNAFKSLVTFMVLGMTVYSSDDKDKMAPVIGAVFALPFIIFSMSGGFLSDRYSKRSVAIGTKAAEVVIMLLAIVGLWFKIMPLMIVVVFLLSTQSAFFGPTKYGLMPEMLPEERLSWGNGVLSLGTFVSIITGIILAGVLSDKFGADRQVWSGVVLLTFSVVGLIASTGIKHVPPANTAKEYRWNFLAEIFRQVRVIRKDRVLTLGVVACVYFWFLAALLNLIILFYAKFVMGLGDTKTGMLLAALAIGIGAGSFAAGYLSGKKIEYGLIPLGAIGLSFFSALLSRSDVSIPGSSLFAPEAAVFASVAILLGLLGFSGGFYIVPINSLIQQRPDPKIKGSVLATNAVFSFCGVFLASCVYYLLKLGLGLSYPQLFLACSLMTLAGTIYILWLLPDALMRLLIWMLTHTLYRVRVRGRGNIPERGGALFVSNHLSLTDAFYLIASTDRQVRFIMFRGMYEKWWIYPFARMLRVIPISSELRPREMIKSLQAATDWIKEGNVVCIFAEGQITRTGQMLPFRKGMQKILKGVDAPIIPVNLDGVWGSIFSFEKGRFYWKLPREIPFPITVSYGEAMPPDSEPHEVRQAVQELGAAAWEERKPRLRPLHRAFIRTARQRRGRFAFADATTPKMSFIGALIGSILLGGRLRKTWEGQKNVGILLPPSVPGALVNYAAMMMGKVPVNLNYTLSEEALASCIEQCGIKNVLTSGRVLKLLKVEIPVETVLLEEVAKGPTVFEKVSALIRACLFPPRLIEKSLGCDKPIQLDDLATIIFSSGSTGEPKGVMLSHYNVMSNVEQLGQVFAFGKGDAFLGVLPFFHSFGFMGTLGAPAGLGVGVGYHANPVDAKTVGKIVEENGITFLLATPTFLQLYLRGCKPEQFGSVEFVMVGAEKLPDRLANAFEEKFGVRPMEAYGCTECSPAVTVNTRDFRAAGVRQVGGKRGAIGHPLPGMSIRIVDPETNEPQPMGQAGLMLVSGPNVMTGYLGQPEKTAEVLRDGWYETGDIAAMDEDGFITITDRLSRFSKIGGEMVPHIKVEEQLHEMADSTEKILAVAGLPDEKKGEKLVVLHTLEDEALAAVLEKLGAADLPNLWKPRKDQFFKVEELPYLGTGKLDLKGVKAKAAELAGA